MTSRIASWKARPVAVMSDEERAAFRLLVATHTRLDGECWTWTRPTTRKGYARAKFRGTLHFLHRVAFVCATGRPLSAEQSVDHICHVRRCLRPSHLRAIPIAVNAGDTTRARQRECLRGHSLRDAIVKIHRRVETFSDGGTVIRLHRHRSCRTCAGMRGNHHRELAA